MLNIPCRITTELPLQTVNISSYGARIQVYQNNNNRRFCISSITDKGNFKQENQDNLLIKYGETTLGSCVLLVVADGIGGLRDGEIASRLVVEKLNKWWNDVLVSTDFKANNNVKVFIIESLRKAIESINMEIYNKGHICGYKMGTTLSLLFIFSNWYYIQHAGDSRVYKLSNYIQQLTEDDNLLNRYIISGVKNVPVEGYDVLANTITNFIGIKPNIEMLQMTGELKEEDSFVLCTDGLYKHISLKEIHKCIYKFRRGAAKSQEVLQKMLLTARSRGESDDISCIIIAPSNNARGLLKKLLKQ